jgi:hypothetical protein
VRPVISAFPAVPCYADLAERLLIITIRSQILTLIFLEVIKVISCSFNRQS